MWKLWAPEAQGRWSAPASQHSHPHGQHLPPAGPRERVLLAKGEASIHLSALPCFPWEAIPDHTVPCPNLG